jgi:hypothetical protein
MALSIALLPLDVANPKFRIYALGDNGTFPTIDFLEQLAAANKDSYDRLMAQLAQVSEHGPITNDKRKSRILKNDPKIYEFKTKDANRITWFYDKGSVILCTHGFHKPNEKTLQQEIKTAVKWNKRYFEAKAKNEVLTESND